ncbi:MAG TPA: VirB8/TrbF family protein [Acidobacteriaceae bacterium]|jgi:hypothetical protein
MKASAEAEASTSVLGKPRYYEENGAIKANSNKAWVLAFLTIPIALMSMFIAAMVRLQPPTVIRIQPNGEATVLGKKTPDGKPSAAVVGADDFLNQAFVRRFLASYLNYSPSNVDDRWANSLNMMTRNLRSASMKGISDNDLRGKIDDEQISSVFHLRDIQDVNGEPLTYLVYGVKDVRRMHDGAETTDHYVNEYRIRLAADQRTASNPEGLWVAAYSEMPIDGERRNQILSAPDQEFDQ